MSAHPGRNDPCPCGSSRKYKHCCLGKDTAAPPGGGHSASGILDELRREIADHDFASLDDLQVYMDAFMHRRNRAPLDDFHGLSPDQMTGLLYAPFDSPRLVIFPEEISGAVCAPILTLFLLLAEAAGERGLKCTAAGNLPPVFCRAAAEVFQDEGHVREGGFGIHKEPDFMELHVTRIVAKLAGLIRQARGRVILTRKARTLLHRGAGAIYPHLLHAHVWRYHWAYADRYPALPFIQQSFLFTIYLLQRYGAEERPEGFYADACLRAFPARAAATGPVTWSTPEDIVRRCYALRTLRRFAVFLGLATLKCERNGPPSERCRLRKTTLVDEAVRFRL